MKNKHFQNKKNLSYLITLIIISILFFIGTTKALELTIENLPSFINENQTLNFDLILNPNTDEIIPIHKIEMQILNTKNNSLLVNCSFDIFGSKLNNCNEISITAPQHINFTYGNLYGYDKKTNKNITFPIQYGYGYGYNWGYGYGYGISKQINNYRYSIAWKTPLINQDLNLKIEFYAIASANNKTYKFEIQNPANILVKDLNKLNPDTQVNTNNTRIIIPKNNNQSNITIYPNTYNFKLDLSQTSNTSGKNTTSSIKNKLIITLSNNYGNFKITIPNNTTFTAKNWNSILHLPLNEDKNNIQIPEKIDYTTTKSILLSIGNNQTQIYMSNAIRIQMNGEKNKLAGFVFNNTFTPITKKCLIDSQDWANINLAQTGACTINNGDNLIIWTKHFTEFITYTQTKISPTESSSSFSTTNPRCTPIWRCDEWTFCNSYGEEYRICTDINDCNKPYESPTTIRTCNPFMPTPETNSTNKSINITTNNQSNEISNLNTKFNVDKSTKNSQQMKENTIQNFIFMNNPMTLSILIIIMIISIILILISSNPKKTRKKQRNHRKRYKSRRIN